MSNYDIENQHVGSSSEAARMKNKEIEFQHVGSSSEAAMMKNKEIEIEHVGSSSEATSQPSAKSIEQMLVEPSVSPLPSKWCIYKVPERLRNLNDALYTPRVVSIGPIHHGDTRFQAMESLKLSFFKHFLGRKEVCVRVEGFVNYIKKHEERIRRCYAERIDLSGEKFVTMILLDGCFIIELFLRTCAKGMADVVDGVLHKQWLETDIYYDLILLENQLPFFVLEGLHNLAFPSNPITPPSFRKLTFAFLFKYKNEKIKWAKEDVKHFTDLIRTLLSPISQRSEPKGSKQNRFPHSAVELDEAGVKFKVSSSKRLLDMSFTKGVLRIPEFPIDDRTESLVKNLMALEQCHYPRATYICDYMVIMDALVNTAKDVEILVRKGIILNQLAGGNDAMASLFNNVSQEITHDLDGSFFCRLCEDLTEYRNTSWHCWIANLKSEYLGTPWKVASVLAAFTLLGLTTMQTVNSFISL